MSSRAAEYDGKKPAGLGYVIKQTEDPLEQDEIKAAKACKKHVVNGLDDRSGLWSLVIVRGHGIPMSSHPKYKEAESIKNPVAQAKAFLAFLAPLVDPTADLVADWANRHGWLHK